MDCVEWVLWWLICFQVSVTSPDDGIVVLLWCRICDWKKVLINIGDKNNKMFQNNEGLKKYHVSPCFYFA